MVPVARSSPSTYEIEAGTHKGEEVTVGVSFQEEGYPEYPPHWIHVTPPLDDGRGGSTQEHTDAHGRSWLAMSRPPGPVWDNLPYEGHVCVHQRAFEKDLERCMRFDAALTNEAHSISVRHLLQHYQADELQEDLCFALWRPSTGRERLTALIDEVILPEDGERRLHGNASFEPRYLARAVGLALRKGAGLAFMHSHPGPGWQGMSEADIEAERDVLAYPAGATGLPLVGLTLGVDGRVECTILGTRRLSDAAPVVREDASRRPRPIPDSLQR